MKKIITILLFLNIILLLHADAKGDEIAKKSFNLKKSNDSTSITIMVLINKNGDKTIRKMESYSKEGKTGRLSFVKFIEPANIKRTSLLTIGYDKGDDDQRMYLPSSNQIRKIATSNKGQKFMGTDLFFFDMEDHQYEDFTYKYIKEESYDGIECYVIAMYPKDQNAPYSKQISWISKKNYFTYKIECYDKKNENKKTKTMIFTDVKDFNGVLIPLKILIDNHVEDHKTIMQETNLRINTGLKDDIFTVHYMQK